MTAGDASPRPGRLVLALALALTGVLSGCFADEGFGLDSDADTDGDEIEAQPCTDARSCVPNTPDGWMGPVARWSGDPGQAVSCPDALPIEWTRLGDAPQADPAECGCSCSSAVSCGAVALELFPFGDCAGTPAAPTVLPDVGCLALGGASGSGAKARVEPPPSPPTCSPTTAQKPWPEPGWQTLTVLCGATDTRGDCGDGAQCVPRAPAPMHEGTCVFRPGLHSCPGGPWSAREVLFEAWTDERTCSTCSCGAPDLGSCAPSVELFTDDACTAPHPAGLLDDACAPMQGYAPRSARREAGSTDLQIACEASGGEPGGSVEAVDPITLCCTA